MGKTNLLYSLVVIRYFRFKYLKEAHVVNIMICVQLCNGLWSDGIECFYPGNSDKLVRVMNRSTIQ